MANLLDYLDWRGDLTLSQSPFNEVDNLIFAELAYLDFAGIVPGPGEGDGIELSLAAECYFKRYPNGKETEKGLLVPEEMPKVLRKMVESSRFNGVRLNCYTETLDTKNASQFAALTAELEDGSIFVAYRGTDETLAGWKEDFYLACMPEVPAQKLAVGYLKQVAAQYPRRRLRLGGHSKGGNLAVYAAAFSPAAIQRRIEKIWSNDGPGFHAEVLAAKGYRRIADRVTTIIPRFSIVGVLLENDENYLTVESNQWGPMQHDGFSWQVVGNRFVHLDGVSAETRRNDRLLKQWLDGMSPERRVTLAEGLFDALEASGAVTLSDLKEEKLKVAEAILRAVKDMDKNTRETVNMAVKLFLQTGVKLQLEEWHQERGHGK